MRTLKIRMTIDRESSGQLVNWEKNHKNDARVYVVESCSLKWVRIVQWISTTF